ncbi:pyroglutamyl-peptidase I [Bdellovibrio sp. HCB337]|uniref:pyroglutamyl-peptidase I family protein n=1 Tax=Bdellovibrio sp. HCB337 TaxID=3394358 RepID=UPI0039A4E6B7
MNSKILVTAFKPFLNHSQNCSEVLLRNLQKERDDIEPLLLPVSFQNTFPEFKKHWQNRGPYKAVVMLGQAAGRKGVNLERVALNWMESKNPDNDGLTPSGKRILRDAPDSYIVDFFPSSWLTLLNDLGPTETSFSAGAYVCNHLYFQVAHELKTSNVPNIFVHLPLLPEQAAGSETSLDGHTQKQVVHELLNLMHGM